MATYDELLPLLSNSELRNRVKVACVIAADTVRGEDAGTANHANRLIWAKRTFTNPAAASREMLTALIAGNKDASVANITGASDAAIQTKVDAAVDVFADGS